MSAPDFGGWPFLAGKSGSFVARAACRAARRPADLINIKVAVRRLPRLLAVKHWGAIDMPTETALVVAGITLAFAVFAVALAWADYQTRNLSPPPGPAE
jgi:hypothetical protein